MDLPSPPKSWRIGDDSILETQTILKFSSSILGDGWDICSVVVNLWYRITEHFVTCYTGPRRQEEDWCLTLADNISRDTSTETIDQIKKILDLTRDPEWHVFYGD